MDLVGFFMLSGSAASVLLIVSLLVRSPGFRNAVLCLLIAGLGYLGVYFYLLVTQRLFDYPGLFFTLFPVALMLGPLAYAYAQVVVEEKKGLDRQDWFHFIPFSASLVILFPFAVDAPDRIREIIYSTFISGENLPLRMTIVAVMFVIPVYLGVIVKYAWPSDARGNSVRMIARFLVGLLLLGIAGALAGMAGLLAYSISLLNAGIVITAVIMFALFVMAQRFPFLVSHGVISGLGTWGRKQALGNEEISNLEKHILLLMDDEHFYRDEALTLSVLSEALEVAPHILARFLNDRYGMNFINYVNGFRIREAAQILVEEPQKNSLAVAYAVGFPSYTDFCTAFLKETGMSPADFRLKNVPQA